jgi:hypothetical protein
MEKPKKPEELSKRLLFKKTTFGRYCLLMVANFGRGRMLRHSRSLMTQTMSTEYFKPLKRRESSPEEEEEANVGANSWRSSVLLKI